MCHKHTELKVNMHAFQVRAHEVDVYQRVSSDVDVN